MQTSTLSLEPLWHRNTYCIAIRGRMNPMADKAVRAFPQRQFSKTNSCWYVPHSHDVLESLTKTLLSLQDIVVSADFNCRDNPKEEIVKIIRFPLPQGYHEKLVNIRYSEATVSTYESQFRMFLGYLYPKTVEDISEEIINRYMNYLAETKKVSTSTQNTAINAIKFYLERVAGNERKVYYNDRPKKEVKLPRVLSQEEVSKLIDVTQNPKHRCMLLLMYSSGLRMSELLNLRWMDFDEDRLQLFVNSGKGKKDRFTILSKAAVEYTKFYMSLHRPVQWLFEGPDGGKYSSRSVNQIVRRSAFLAGIQKRISAHTLRHSFATHLMENLVDTRYIQALMGHESIKTTERYTHVTTRGFSQIKSPLDSLNIDFKPPKQLDK